MRRGTTPIFNFAINVDLTDATVFVTFTQKATVIEKTGDALVVSPYNIEVQLTQEDTLAFTAGKPVKAQIRYVLEDGYADASDIYELSVEDILKDGEIVHVS